MFQDQIVSTITDNEQTDNYDNLERINFSCIAQVTEYSNNHCTIVHKYYTIMILQGIRELWLLLD